MFNFRQLETRIGVVIALGVLLHCCAAAPALASGVSLSGGLGLFISTDDAVYFDTSVDLYPEVGGSIDISMLRLGLKAGLIYRELEVEGYYYDPYYYNDFYYDYTIAFIPVQAELLLAPLAAGKVLPTFSPYVGGMVGAFIPVGDNDETIPAFSVKAGADINMDPIFLYLDGRYTHAPKDSRNYGGIILMAGAGLRFGM